MSVATSSPQAQLALKPCGFTKGELIDLLKQADKDEVKFDRYFFTNVPGTKKHPTREELDDTLVRCLECGCTIGEHVIVSVVNAEALKTSPKRQRDESWKLAIRVIKGASFQHLRQRLYQLAEKHLAHGGTIQYEAPVIGTSDLVAELYFESRRDAEVMETVIRQAVRDRWRSPNMPQTSITVESIDITSLKRVFADHYDQTTSPDRLLFECTEAEEPSAATTVLDAEEIGRESVVDPTRTRLKFEKCHIDASIKGTTSDTTGNHIPLPVDWHKFFDGYTSDNVASISIVAATGEKGLAPLDSDGRAAVLVHVYFDPNSEKAQRLAVELRGAIMVRPDVVAVTVWKEEAPFFVTNLQKRHDAVVQQWKSVP